MTTQDFLDAARLGVSVQIEAGLRADPSLVRADGVEGRAALHMAAYSGHREIVERLLDGGADVNRRDRAGRTPLVHMVSWCTRRDLVGLLLARGADVNARDASGNSALYAAAACIRRPGHAWGDHAALVGFLLENGAALDLWTATILNRHEAAASLLDADPALAARKDKDVGNIVDGATALHRASEWGSLETARVLLSRGADAGAQDGRGRTPLYLAAHEASPRKEQPSPALVDLLLEQGAALDIFTSAVLGRRDSLAALLDADGSLVNARDGGGSTPLHLAAWNRKPEAADLLLERGADMDARNARGETPAQLADGDLARRLIGLGASYDIFRAIGLGDDWVEKCLRRDPAAVSQTNRYGRTPLRVASESVLFGNASAIETVNLLLAHGAVLDIWTAATLGKQEAVAARLNADPSLLNAYDNTHTPLHRAVAQGHLPVVELLAERGAALEAVTIDGATPLILALWSGRKEVAHYLADHGANTNALDGWTTEPWIASALAE